MSEWILAEPKMLPTICFSKMVSCIRFSVTSCLEHRVDVRDHDSPSLGRDPQDGLHHRAPADAHGTDDLVAHVTPGLLSDERGGLLDRRGHMGRSEGGGQGALQLHRVDGKRPPGYRRKQVQEPGVLHHVVQRPLLHHLDGHLFVALARHDKKRHGARNPPERAEGSSGSPTSLSLRSRRSRSGRLRASIRGAPPHRTPPSATSYPAALSASAMRMSKPASSSTTRMRGCFTF